MPSAPPSASDSDLVLIHRLIVFDVLFLFAFLHFV
jgi:hypothetical protein